MHVCCFVYFFRAINERLHFYHTYAATTSTQISRHVFAGSPSGSSIYCRPRLGRYDYESIKLGQGATIASAEFICLLHTKRANSTNDMSLTTIGAHGANYEPCIAMQGKARLAFAAMLGIAKCLPYELPSLLVIPCDLDPYAPEPETRQTHRAANLSHDTYGVGLQCNTTRVPLMLYPGLPKRPEARTTHSLCAAYIVTGAQTRYSIVLLEFAKLCH